MVSPQSAPETPPAGGDADVEVLGPAPAANATGNATTSGTTMVPVQFTVPQTKVACVRPGKLLRIQGAINVDPPSVGFGEIAPGDLQGNAAALRLTNPGQNQQTITHISCAPLEKMSPSVIPFFVVQFGDGPQAPRVKCDSRFLCSSCCQCVHAAGVRQAGA